MYGLSYWFIPLFAGCVWLGMSCRIAFEFTKHYL